MSYRYLFLLLLLKAGLVWAGALDETVRQRLLALQPDLQIEQLVPAAKPGWYQVQLRGGQFLYVDEPVEFVFQGDLYQVQGEQASNLTQQARNRLTAARLKEIPDEEVIVFPARERWASISVFTDVDCSYCQKLHSEVAELNRLGVEVRYLAFPRQGLSGKTYDRMVGVWCAEDPQDAMSRAKQRQEIARKSCKHPVDKQYALGQALGIQGTPAIILQNGEMVPGYMPAAQLAQRAAGGQ